MKAEELEPHEKCLGTFRPQRTDDLKPDMSPPIGAELRLRAGWVMERGAYRGQWVFLPRFGEPYRYGWLPHCDLPDLRLEETGERIEWGLVDVGDED